jgi:hypothetical protein
MISKRLLLPVVLTLLTIRPVAPAESAGEDSTFWHLDTFWKRADRYLRGIEVVWQGATGKL